MKTSSLTQIIILLIAIFTFIIESFLVKQELRNILYITFLIIFLLITLILIYFTIKKRLDEIRDNKERIEKLEKELNYVKNLEDIKVDLSILKREVKKK